MVLTVSKLEIRVKTLEDENINLKSKVFIFGEKAKASEKYNHEIQEMTNSKKPKHKISSDKGNKYAIHAYTHGPVTGSGPSVVEPLSAQYCS